MKAEEILRKYEIVNSWNEVNSTHIQAMQEYARIQIEKDRERIIPKLSFEFERKLIKDLPITLD